MNTVDSGAEDPGSNDWQGGEEMGALIRNAYAISLHAHETGNTDVVGSCNTVIRASVIIRTLADVFRAEGADKKSLQQIAETMTDLSKTLQVLELIPPSSVLPIEREFPRMDAQRLLGYLEIMGLSPQYFRDRRKTLVQLLECSRIGVILRSLDGEKWRISE